MQTITIYQDGQPEELSNIAIWDKLKLNVEDTERNVQELHFGMVVMDWEP